MEPPQDLPRTGPIGIEIVLKLDKIGRLSRIGIRPASLCYERALKDSLGGTREAGKDQLDTLRGTREALRRQEPRAVKGNPDEGGRKG